jgi:EAL domain-containing protein (putative c-di-GMP-specific phosphodiesterase class I)
MHATVTSQLQIESELCLAVERGELFLEYQPVVALDQNRVVGFEALVRWRRPNHGVVGPMDFIPVAEETGLIRPLGDWVMREACRQLGEWHRAGHATLTMSVNLSPRQFAHSELPVEIERAAHDGGVAPALLAVEITESAMMPRGRVESRTLRRIRDLGIAISLDDFGTGYSCLSYLHELPITTMKIDRSFVHRIGMRSERPEIVQAIVSLAHSLGLGVTAEGVETVEQLERLRELTCEHAQGFYFSEPLDPAGALALALDR